jgi:DNA repair exonuclease SbcCD ATPase subunit
MKTNKRIRLQVMIIIVTCIPLLGISQSILDKFENSDRIGSVIINKGMLDIFVNMALDDKDNESKDFVEIAKSIDNIKIYISEDKGASADMSVTMIQYVKSSTLVELMKVRDGDTRVSFYIKEGKDENHVEELLMFVTGMDKSKSHGQSSNMETVLLSMTGNIDLTKIGALSKKMGLHEGLNKLDRK